MPAPADDNAARRAESTEPQARAVWQAVSDRRAANMRKLADDPGSSGGLRPGLSIDEAAAVIWATNSAALYVLLTVERGWPPESPPKFPQRMCCRRRR